MIHGFRELKGNDSRMAALDALVKELSPYEWRAVRSLLDARTFQLDIVGTLPVELVAHIFSYLDILTPFRLQAVSKRWRTLLRSPVIWNQSLKAWYDGVEEYGRYTRIAQNIHQFRTGQYTDLYTVTSPDKIVLLDRNALVEDTLVGVTSDERGLVVANLRTPIRWKTQGDAREKIIAVDASDQLVAYATTLNVCYVSNLAGEDKARFKLPSGMFKVLACRGRTVVCGGTFGDAAEVYVWNFDTLKGKSFRIGFGHSPFVHRTDRCVGADMAIIPNPSSRTLTVFTSHRCTSSNCDHKDKAPYSVHYARFTFEGDFIKDDRFDEPAVDGAEIFGVRPVDRCGRYALTFRHSPPVSLGDYTLPGDEQGSFIFDETLDRFIHPGCPVPSPYSSCVLRAGVSLWKDTFYQITPNGSIVLLACRGTEDHPRYRPVLREEEYDERFGRTAQLLLNDKFAVVLDAGSISVVSFCCPLEASLSRETCHERF